MNATLFAGVNNMISNFLSRDWQIFLRLIGIITALPVLFLSSQAECQTTITPNVIVDESVLDELGPRFNLPSIMRGGEHGYVPPPQYRRRYIPGASGPPGRLLPAPEQTPRSHLMVPRTLPGSRLTRPSRRLTPPPKQTLGKGPSVLGQVKQSEIDNLTQKTKQSKPAPTLPPSRPANVPPPPVASGSKDEIVPALPNKVQSKDASTQSVQPNSQASAEMERPASLLSSDQPSESKQQPKVKIPLPPNTEAPKMAVPNEEVKTPIVPPPPSVTPQSTKSETSAVAAPRVSVLPPNSPTPEVRDGGRKVTVFFPANSTDIPPGVDRFFKEIIDKMRADKSVRLQLRGYAGSGDSSVSQARRVSLFRALSVRTYLMKSGIRSTRMDIRALGNKVEKGNPDRVDVELKN